MPTSPIVTHGGAGGPIFGRERELAVLDELVDGLPERGAALLAEARTRVLRTTGVQSEAQLPYAGMHQLVLPVLDQADRLPGPHHTALLEAFGMTEEAAPDRFLITLAVLKLLSDAAERARCAGNYWSRPAAIRSRWWSCRSCSGATNSTVALTVVTTERTNYAELRD